jgi:chloramphenicol O-acetyltransferase type B
MGSLRLTLKSAVRAVTNRWRFPGRQIGTLSYLSPHCRLARDAVIGENCHVFHSEIGGGSKLGPEVIVGHHTRLGSSVLGRGCIIETHVEIFNSTFADFVSVQPRASLNHVNVGRYSYIAREAYLNDVSIGSFASIGPQTLLGTGEHPANFISTAPVFYSTRRQCGNSFAHQDHFPERKRIALGHDVWIGARVFVRDGVTIGDGAIVAAGSVVSADVPAYAIVGGVPAKLIRMRFGEDQVKRLLELQWWNWEESRLRSSQPWFAQTDVEAFFRKTIPEV